MIWAIAKMIGCAVAGSGASMVVNNIVLNNLPENMDKKAKIMTTIGASVLSNVAGGAAAQHVIDEVDSIHETCKTLNDARRAAKAAVAAAKNGGYYDYATEDAKTAADCMNEKGYYDYTYEEKKEESDGTCD